MKPYPYRKTFQKKYTTKKEIQPIEELLSCSSSNPPYKLTKYIPMKINKKTHQVNLNPNPKPK
jgi:hypothetical protein